MNILDVSGQTAVVTGGGQGVGRQAALHLAAHGARVVVNDYFADRAESVAAEINASASGRAIGVAGDVSSYESVSKLAEAAKSAFGPVGILVNNAGNAGPTYEGVTMTPFWEQEPAQWGRWLDVNLIGVMNCCRAFLPDMVAAGRGSVVSVISDAGRVGEPGLEAYSAAKAGAAGLTRALARSLGRFDVRANCVAISGTRTPSTEALLSNPDFAKRALSKYVLRRFGEPDDAANMILFLSSGASSWVTGQTYPVNGGFDMAV